jgi:hypothetical protein
MSQAPFPVVGQAGTHYPDVRERSQTKLKATNSKSDAPE